MLPSRQKQPAHNPVGVRSTRVVVPNLFTGTSFMEDNFSMDSGGGRWFGDDSDTLHLLCHLFP